MFFLHPDLKLSQCISSILGVVPLEHHLWLENRLHEKDGPVKFFNEKKGFGFLTNENGKDVFVHANNLTDNITDGDTVYYDIEETPKGLSAINVKLTE